MFKTKVMPIKNIKCVELNSTLCSLSYLDKPEVALGELKDNDFKKIEVVKKIK